MTSDKQTVPPDLAGTLYRNGPGLFDRFGERYPHWFDGDGAISAVRFAGGTASGAARVIETPAFAREERAGKRLFGGYNTPLARPLREILLRDTKNAANTSVMIYEGRPYALCEAGRPFEISPRDLSTVGQSDLGGIVARAFSAHPHDVPARGALYDFGLRIGPKTQVDVYALAPGSARTIATFSFDGMRMVHDFVATDRHLLFVISPLFLRILPMVLKRGGPVDCAEWRAGEGTEIVIVPLDDPRAIARFHVDAFHLEHTVNAFSRGDELVFDFIHYDDYDGLERFVGGLARGVVRAPLGSSVRRATVDVRARTLRMETRLARPCELPRVSPSVDAAPHRWAYLAGHASAAASGAAPFDALLKLDVDTGEVATWAPGPGRYPSEAVFVPCARARAEDDGHLLTLVYDADTDASHVAVLDARDLRPVAKAMFDHAIPFGFHGAWAPGPR